MQLYPTLEHCIETTARHEFNRMVEHCLAAGEVDKHSADRIDLLRNFLETADFRALRQESSFYLIMGEKVRFVLSDNEGKVCCRMEIVQDPLLE